MNYIEYFINYLKNKIDFYNNLGDKVEPEIVHEAQMILKEILDLEDQGYMYSYNKINNELDAVNTLSTFITSNKGKIIRPVKKDLQDKLIYNNKEIELMHFINNLKYSGNIDEDDKRFTLINDILNYSKWIYKNIEKDTVYICLLRDAFLPYLALRNWSEKDKINIKPWLIGRKWLSQFPSCESITNNTLNKIVGSKKFANNDELYEFIYTCLFTALNENNKDFEAFSNSFTKHFNQGADNFPNLVKTLKNLLNSVKEKHIVLIESGRYASIPMLLRAIDKRVDFRLFTTTPMFYDVYKNKFFSKEFDKNRLFENLNCQDDLFIFSSFKNNKFYINMVESDLVEERANNELGHWNKLINNIK